MGGASNRGWSEPAMTSNFVRHIFGTFRDEANTIMQRHEVRASSAFH